MLIQVSVRCWINKKKYYIEIVLGAVQDCCFYMEKLNMCLGIRHLNNKREDPFCVWHVIHIREGTHKFTGVSKTVEICVKLYHVIIFNSLLTHLYLFRNMSHHCIDELIFVKW